MATGELTSEPDDGGFEAVIPPDGSGSYDTAEVGQLPAPVWEHITGANVTCAHPGCSNVITSYMIRVGDADRRVWCHPLHNEFASVNHPEHNSGE